MLIFALLTSLFASASIVQGTITASGLDFNNDGTPEYNLSMGGAYLTFSSTVAQGTNVWTIGTFDTGQWDEPQNLTNGTSVGANGTWGAEGDCSLTWGQTPLPTGQVCYIGFRIHLNDGNHYGWGSVTVVNSSTATWHAIYYETNVNTAITVGSTSGGGGDPDPGPTPGPDPDPDPDDPDPTIPGNSYIIHASAGDNGIITPSGNVVVAEGASQSFALTAYSGYRVSAVTVDGAELSAVLTMLPAK